MSIIVWIAVITTILSATLTEVTIKGLVALALASTSLFLGIKARADSRGRRTSSAAHSIQTFVDMPLRPGSRIRSAMRVVVGGAIAGLIAAILIATALATFVQQFLSRLR